MNHKQQIMDDTDIADQKSGPHPEGKSPWSYSTIWGGCLCLLFCWPIGHRWLVEEYALNPWQGFGVAMYCTLSRTELLVKVKTPAGWFKVDRFPTPRSSEAIKRFSQARHQFGVFSSSKGVAEAILAENPQISEVAIGARRKRLKPSQHTYVYDNQCLDRYQRTPQGVVLVDSQIERYRHLQQSGQSQQIQR